MANEETPQPVNSNPVGTQLKKAREARGLDVSDIANAQHLRTVVIEAIEAGDYSKIDSELFLKGYVRAFAGQVGLDADSIIADLDKELEPLREQRKQEFEANPLVDIERRRSRKRRLAKGVLFLVAAAIVAWIVVYFVLPSQPFSGAPDNATSATEESASSSSAPTDNGASDLVSDSEQDTPVVAPSEAGLAMPEEAAEADGVQGEAPDTVTAIAEASDNVAPEATVPEDIAVEGSDVPAEVSFADAEVTEAEPVSDTNGRLQITFAADCWVRVSDAAGNRLVNSLKREGDTIDVTGEAPLSVVIGAVDAVRTIRFQGEPLNMSNYPVDRNRSEFTLTI